MDTTVMAGDCLTKAMQEAYLRVVLDTNIWNYAQTPEAKAVKQRKQKQRKKKDLDEDVENAGEGDDELRNHLTYLMTSYRGMHRLDNSRTAMLLHFVGYCPPH
eukprot:16313070-Heterocapsa_arctica.AAC.1